MKRSFGMWLILIFVISIVLPLTLLSMALIAFFNQVFVKETERLFMTTLYSVSQNITTYVNDLGRLSMTPYYYSEMITYLNYMNNGLYYTDPVAAWRINKDYRLTIAQQLDTSRSDVIGVLFVPFSEEGSTGFLVRRYTDSLQVINDLDATGSDWYEGTIRANGQVYFIASEPDYYRSQNNAFFYTDNGRAVISVARLIKDPDSMKPIGILRVDAVDSVIRDIFQNIPMDSQSAVMLLDGDNNIIYSNNHKPHLPLELSPGVQRFDYEEDSYRVSMAPVGSSPWSLCYFASEREAKQQTVQIILITSLCGVLCFLIAMILFYASSRNTIRAMAKILSALQRIADGNLDVHLDIRGAGYLTTIANALNQTAVRLKNHIQKEYQALLSQRNAEYLALQSQINPHFLNNVLSGFVTLNQLGERQTLERSILQLSHLFGYIARNGGKSSVGTELKFLGEYLALQKMRFADRLRFHLYSTPEADLVVIPKLLLQPIVENAIIHGMEPYDCDLLVEVMAEVVVHPPLPPMLVIVVRDDGEGFEPGPIKPDSTGLGNIRERLLIFSPDSLFQIRTAPGKGCMVTLALPLVQKEE